LTRSHSVVVAPDWEAVGAIIGIMVFAVAIATLVLSGFLRSASKANAKVQEAIEAAADAWRRTTEESRHIADPASG
jgi:hypothetical protein